MSAAIYTSESMVSKLAAMIWANKVGLGSFHEDTVHYMALELGIEWVDVLETAEGMIEVGAQRRIE